MYNFNLASLKEMEVNGTTYKVLTGTASGLWMDEDLNRLSKAAKAVEDAGISASSVILASVSPLGNGAVVGAMVTQWINGDERKLIFGIGKMADPATLAHELEHVRQMESGELVLNLDGSAIWKGTLYENVPNPGDVSRMGEYFNLPWEVEAYKVEHAVSSIGKYLPFKVWFNAKYVQPYRLAAWLQSKAKK